MKIRTSVDQQNSFNRQRWVDQPMATRGLRNWLISTDSLTARLKNRYADFYVKPLVVEKIKAGLEEANCLAIKTTERALIREVLLYGDDKPVIFAHSVLPKKSLRGEWRVLGALGNKPLGEALFSNPKVQRTPLRFKKLNKHHALYQKAVQHLDEQPAFLWARRSAFSLNCANILVTEVFLPAIH